ncbi:TetR/AcrR family transcriptional regulator [Fusibacter sp. JL216-2]|uniref:TetR/AcrR family transcriptional regulator n=1 Tax=Fusibacter sp. JL216-2 TaxID=3071453 RepID=UPI003D348F56
MENSKENLTFRQRQSLETKERIQATSIKLFQKYGYHNVSIAQITNEADVSKGSFYTHFDTKSDVLNEHYMDDDNHYLNYKKTIDTLPTTPEKLMAFTKYVYTWIGEEVGWELMGVIYGYMLDSNSDNSGFLDPDRPFYRILMDIVEEGQKLEDIRSDRSPFELVQIIVSNYRGVFYDWCISQGGFDLLSRGELSMSVLLDGILYKAPVQTR